MTLSTKALAKAPRSGNSEDALLTNVREGKGELPVARLLVGMRLEAFLSARSAIP